MRFDGFRKLYLKRRNNIKQCSFVFNVQGHGKKKIRLKNI